MENLADAAHYLIIIDTVIARYSINPFTEGDNKQIQVALGLQVSKASTFGIVYRHQTSIFVSKFL